MLRFAPSPTGDMHIDSLRVAIVNYMVAKQKGETFLVRITDTHKEQNLEGKDTEILQILEKFALTHDQTMHQSEHLNIHQTLAIRLLEEGKAFISTCTSETLETDRCETIPHTSYSKLKEEKTPFVLRLKKPTSDIATHDLIQGDITTSAHDIDSFVILQADGTPSDDFATACDDMLNNITLVIRAEEYLSNTPKQQYIQTLLGYEERITYAHLPTLLHSEGKKMSEHNSENSVKWLFEEGFIPDAILNYLMLLSHKTPTEVFTLPEAMEWFRLEDISKSTVIFDLERLRFLNREHLKKMDSKALSTLFGFADSAIGDLVKVYLQEVSTLKELRSKITPIFSPKTFEGKWEQEMRSLQTVIKKAPPFKAYNAFESHLIEQSGLTGEKLLKPLRLLLTNAEYGPELNDIYPSIESYLLEVIT
jgi:glutamyl-tRNA synthetase